MLRTLRCGRGGRQRGATLRASFVPSGRTPSCVGRGGGRAKRGERRTRGKGVTTVGRGATGQRARGSPPQVLRVGAVTNFRRVFTGGGTNLKGKRVGCLTRRRAIIRTTTERASGFKSRVTGVKVAVLTDCAVCRCASI